MKNRDVKLERLFEAARTAPAPDAPPEMPAHLKTRVLAHWRSDADESAGWLSLAALYRNALVCAGLAMLLCVVWNQLDPASADYSQSYSEAQTEESIDGLRDELIP